MQKIRSKDRHASRFSDLSVNNTSIDVGPARRAVQWNERNLFGQMRHAQLVEMYASKRHRNCKVCRASWWMDIIKSTGMFIFAWRLYAALFIPLLWWENSSNEEGGIARLVTVVVCYLTVRPLGRGIRNKKMRGEEKNEEWKKYVSIVQR